MLSLDDIHGIRTVIRSLHPTHDAAAIAILWAILDRHEQESRQRRLATTDIDDIDDILSFVG